MDDISAIVRADRIAKGLSLQGLADKLNADRSLEIDRKITTSWLHHLENDRAKPLSTSLKKGLARALGQDESKYLSTNESLPNRTSSFTKFFDEQLPKFDIGSVLICDFHAEEASPEELADLLSSIYQFLLNTDGKVIAFERSGVIALPVLLTAVRCWPGIDDGNIHSAVSKIVAPLAAGGFLDCRLPQPSHEVLHWVTSRVEVLELTADEQAAGLLANDALTYLSVVSPGTRQGTPEKWNYYYLNSREYGLLQGSAGEKAYRRFLHYRDARIFSRHAYEEAFPFSFEKPAGHYHLRFETEGRLSAAS